jgi:2,4-dienoyl-CoA reductase-like NADH-dependent reductase (Old Yellow Enzyme family)
LGEILVSILFEPTTLKGMSLANRFVRSATWEGMATSDGICTGQLTETMARLAEGGVGLIITSHAYVSREGQASPWQAGIHDDTTIPGLTQMADAVHQQGGRIAVQLAHAGGRAATGLSGLNAMGPSVVRKDGAAICTEMSQEDIANVVRAFGVAAARAKRCGFDAIQIHAAHGYLLSQFLSPKSNQRSDQYGGTLADRSRVVLEVLRRAREVVGRDYPVFIKLNSEDFVDGGFSVEDMLELAGLLEEAEIDAIELSGGSTASEAKYSSSRLGAVPKGEAYYRDAAKRFKQKTRVPLILVGGIRSLDVAEHLVAEGTADYIALSRPLICEPDLVSRWKSGDTAKSACISDNGCFNPARNGEGLRCTLWERVSKENGTIAK